VEQLKKLNTDDIEPLAQVVELQNIFRKDEVQKGLNAEQALSNAPVKTVAFIKVPKVIGE
jgi:aspartyl-tRNA(Asn)/glutamyl-tRNA(Gln) amidotransferase subunit C